MEIAGQIEYGEGARWGQRACSRLNGYPWSLMLGLAAGAAAAGVAILLTGMIVVLIDLPTGVETLIMLVLVLPAAWMATRLVQKWQVRRMRRALADRGIASPFALRYSVTPNAFEVTTDRVRVQADWDAVSEVFSVGPYWVFLVDGSPRFLPKRYFPDAAAEKLFVAAALRFMSAEARLRSAAAVRFAGASS